MDRGNTVSVGVIAAAVGASVAVVAILISVVALIIIIICARYKYKKKTDDKGNIILYGFCCYTFLRLAKLTFALH